MDVVCDEITLILQRERPLMMSDFLGGGGFIMTLKYWTLEGKIGH